MSALKFILTVVVTLCVITYSEALRVDITPQLAISGTNQGVVNIKCDASGERDIRAITHFQLVKVEGRVTRPLAVYVAYGAIMFSDPSLGARAQGSGSIRGTSSYFNLRLNAVRASDAGTYRCRMGYINVNHSKVDKTADESLVVENYISLEHEVQNLKKRIGEMTNASDVCTHGCSTGGRKAVVFSMNGVVEIDTHNGYHQGFYLIQEDGVYSIHVTVTGPRNTSIPDQTLSLNLSGANDVELGRFRVRSDGRPSNLDLVRTFKVGDMFNVFPPVRLDDVTYDISGTFFSCFRIGSQQPSQ